MHEVESQTFNGEEEKGVCGVVWCDVMWGEVGRCEGNSIELSGSVPYFVLGPSQNIVGV